MFFIFGLTRKKCLFCLVDSIVSSTIKINGHELILELKIELHLDQSLNKLDDYTLHILYHYVWCIFKCLKELTYNNSLNSICVNST